MRCRRCGFENMPGLERCGRCSSVLVLREPVVVTPPRATGPLWLRRTGYRVRSAMRFALVQPSIVQPSAPAVSAAPPQPPLWPGVASVVPGLGHLLTGRLRRVRWWWIGWALIGWCVCLMVGLFLYGGWPGGLFLGMAMGLHAWIICDAAQVDQRYDSAAMRIGASILVFILVVWGLYLPARAAAGHWMRGVSCAVDIEAAGIHQGDMLLMSSQAYATDSPRRGDIVAYTVAEHRVIEQYWIQGGDVVSEVIALPGDVAAFYNGRIAVCEPGGRVTEYAPPQHPVTGTFEVTVPAGTYLCLPPEFSTPGHGGRAPASAEYVRMVAMPADGDLRGRAFMVWNPLWRRHWISQASAEVAP